MNQVKMEVLSPPVSADQVGAVGMNQEMTEDEEPQWSPPVSDSLLTYYQQTSYNQTFETSFSVPSMSMPTQVSPQLVPAGYVYLEDGSNYLLNANSTACQLSSSHPQEDDGNKAQSSRKSKEDVFQKRVHSLKKNREAAQMSRQRKKNYIASLESHLVELENQNKILTEEIGSLKSLNGHKD